MAGGTLLVGAAIVVMRTLIAQGWRSLLAVVVAVLTACPSAFALAPPPARYGHAGRWITDAEGRVVIIHGVNVVYKVPPYYPAASGFSGDDAAFLAAHGFNAVRVGVIYKALEPLPGVYDDSYLRQVATTVKTLANHGIASLLDFHQDMYNERFQGEGFPDWTVQDDGLPAQPRLGFPGNYFGMPAQNRAWDHFWGNSPGPGAVGLQDQLARAWRHVAERFAGDPNVLGYELLNEPWPGSQWPMCGNPSGCPVFDQGPLAGLYRRLFAAIRQVDRQTLVWYEPNVIFNDGADTGLPDFGDRRAGFAFHDYCLSKGATGSYQGCNTPDDIVFANALRHAAATGDSLLESEWGGTRDPTTINSMRTRADRNMVGWLEWAYCTCQDPTGGGSAEALVTNPAKPPSGANVDAAKLGLLEEPYPEAIAGTPKQFAYNASNGTFALGYAARPAGGGLALGALTDVFVPVLHYPHGFSYRLTGAVVARSRLQHLLLRNAAGGSHVALTITPVVRGAPLLPGSNYGLPRPASRRVRLAISQRYGHVVKAVVYVDGLRVRTVRGKRISYLMVRAPRRASFNLRLALTTNGGHHSEITVLYRS